MQQDAPFAARRRHSVPHKIDYITISVKNSRKQSELGPVADNFCGPNIFAPLETGQKRCDNMQAAQLAVNDNNRLSMLTKKFSETFLKYHKACVEVICTTTKQGGAIRGSGFLFKTPNSRVILITAAHIVPALYNSGFIVIESDYQYLSQFHDQIQARKVTIPISCCGFKINAALDTAVIWLSASMNLIELIDEFPYLSLASASSASNTFMSIHYANNNDKQVCVGFIGSMQQEFSSLRLKIHIDGGQGASGAPLFNIEGHVVAILQSSQRDETRNFLPIERILLELNYYSVHFELELQLVEKNEGDLLKAFLIEQYGFGHSNETVTSFNTMLYKNPDRLRLALFHGLGRGGVHKETSKWSLRGYIESDHFPAYSAYDCRDMSRDLFPAITIPKVIHDILPTTRSKLFRSTQREYIRAKNCCQAIVENFHHYKEKGLFTRSNYDCTDDDFKSLLVQYSTGFNEALKLHKELKLISEDGRKNLKRLISDCIREGRNTGNELKPDHRIRIRSNSVPR